MKPGSENAKCAIHNQLVHNVGLYYVCYELSRRGLDAMPTPRNVRGIDVVAYNQKGSKRHTIKVKSLSCKNPVPFGNSLNTLIAEYIFIVNNVSDVPNLYIVDTPTAKPIIHEQTK
ncbi:MAG: hypothetical protein QW767_06855, partial [Thermoprotei archaeon]